MNLDYFVIIKWMVIVILGGVTFYLKNYTNVLKVCSKYIQMAEIEFKDVAKSGDLKITWCVNKLNTIIPTVLKPILTDELLKSLVQNAFDEIEDYAKIQIAKATIELNDKVDKADKKLEAKLKK